MNGFKYFFTGRYQNTYYFRALYHYREYDNPDYDTIRVVRLCRVYLYPFHSPVYSIRTRWHTVKNGITVETYDSGWNKCKVSEFQASPESVVNISDICGIRVYKGAWE